LHEQIQKLDRADNFEKSYATKLNREALEDRKEKFLWASCLSFKPDHALDSIDSFIFDEYASGTADKRTPAILAQALYGLSPLNRQ
jgi:hypothetical protein